MSSRRKARPEVNLQTKAQPAQDRSRVTYDAILKSAGELLAEVGIERFSTNLVCERAGLTPPALYRYFPNKYALLKELATRLMAAQDVALVAAIGQTGLARVTPAEALARAKDRQVEINRVTAAFPGGPWIMRVMRAVPLLREVRQQSVNFAADHIFRQMRERYPHMPEIRLRTATFMAVELSYAATEMAFDAAPEEADRITHELAVMMFLYFSALDQNVPGLD